MFIYAGKNNSIILNILIIILFISCDTIKGATMRAYNIDIPIEDIYVHIKENNDIFMYESIDIITDSQNNKKKIRIFVYGFHAYMEYFDEEKIYLQTHFRYLNAPGEILQFSLDKLIELKLFLKEKYDLMDNDIIIETYGIKNK